MSREITVSEANRESVADFVKLSKTHYESEPVTDPDFVSWKHLDPPIGPSISVDLVSNGVKTGRMLINRYRWCVNGELKVLANPCDFLIDPDHRSVTDFLLLLKSSMKTAKGCADFVYHTSNPTTEDLYRKLLKLEPVTELDGAIIPINPCFVGRSLKVLNLGIIGRFADSLFRSFLRLTASLALLSRITIQYSEFGRDEHALAARMRSEQALCNARSPEDLKWRFKGAGPNSYTLRQVRKGEKLIATVVTTRRELNGIQSDVIVDLVWPGPIKPRDVRLTWLLLASKSATAGSDALFFFANVKNPTLNRLMRAPFVRVPRSRLPQRVPVFVSAGHQDDEGVDSKLDWASAYWVLADFDHF